MSPSLKETIGKIYALLNSENLKPLEVVRSKWEEELGINITDDEWQDIIDGIQSSSICQRHRVIQFKVVHRLHWSKVKLAQIKSDVDGLCDRCRADDGTLAHMFYHCPKLTEFWKSIFAFFSKVLEIDIKPFSITTIFGVADSKLNLNTTGKTIISFSTLLARRLILTKWKDRTPPTFKHWINDLMGHLSLERIRYSLQGNTQKFFSIWQPVLNTLEDMDTTLF